MNYGGVDPFDLASGLSRAVDATDDGQNSIWNDPNIDTEASYLAMQRRLENEHRQVRSVPNVREQSWDGNP